MIKRLFSYLFGNLFGSTKNVVMRATGILFDYQLNDPGTPALVRKIEIPDPPQPCPPFAVQGWNGTAGNPGDLQAQAAEVYATLIYSLRFINGKLDAPVDRWSSTNMLVVSPRAGRDFNAYYDRSSLRFFYNQNPRTGKMVYTCESPDVVSHELGHGILDSLRPDLWGAQALEIFAFHESFGDMNAILTTLSHPEVIDYVIQETNGDLKHSNVVSRLAEEMGAAIYDATGGSGGRSSDSLRNAINSFQWSPPESLPRSGPDNQLNGEPHNFSRVFTGAFYDMLAAIYQSQCNQMDQRSALGSARDLVGRILYNGVRNAHVSPRFYDSVARAMLVADTNYGGVCHDAITKSFLARRILRDIPMGMAPTTMKMNYSKNCKVHNFAGGSTVRIGGVKTIKLCEEAVLAQSDNPLYNISVEMPSDHYLEYNEKGMLKFEIPFDKDESINCVKSCLDYLHEKKKVSLEGDDEKQFKIVDNKLVRNHICSWHNH